MWLGEYLDVDSEPATKAKWGDKSGMERSLIPEVHAKDAFEDLERLANNEHLIPFVPSPEKPDERNLDNPSLWELISLPWWSRLWTLQEYVLPGNVTLALAYTFKRTMHAGFLRDNLKSAKDNDILWTRYVLAERQASDPLDRIFGLFGLFPEIAANITISYSESPLQVSIDFFLYLVTSSRNLRAWAGLADIPRDSSWPSWVPNWCYNPEVFESMIDTHILSVYDMSIAAGNTELNLGRPYPEVLSLVGIQLGQVAEVRDYRRSKSRSPFRKGSEPEPDVREFAFENLLKSMSIDTSQDYPAGKTYGEVIVELEEIARYGATNIFLTGRGYLGCDFNNVAVGDTIHVLFGGNLPFVLRESKRRAEDQVRYHEINGAVYIPGIMNGEAMEWGLEPETYFIV
ncbi:hypothetical protein PG989_012511 [Apiospora arundinis]